MIEAIRVGLSVKTKRLIRARLWRIRTVRRFARRDDGIAAVEFGIVALPFFAMMFAIIETAMVFFASQVLETAVADSARLIMTGQAQQATPPFTAEKFKEAVCAKIPALFDCGGIQIDVKTFTGFSSVSTTKPIGADGKLQTDNFGYAPGKQGDVVLVRLMYQWPVYTSLLGLDKLADLSNNKRLIMASAAFRNEPY